MPLKLVLKPGEKIVINQAVLVNGKDRTELIIQNRANILREKDIMIEDRADTPAKSIYFVVQLMHLFPENFDKHQESFNRLVREFVTAVPSATEIVLEIGQRVLNRDTYGALRQCRELIRYEQEVLKNAESKL